MMLKLAGFTALILSFAGLSADAEACTCRDLAVSEKLMNAAEVFSGKVVGIVPTRIKGATRREVKFKVLEAWTPGAQEKKEISILTLQVGSDGAGSAECLIDFKKGESYLVLAHAQPAGGPYFDKAGLGASICGGTTLLKSKEGEEILAYLATRPLIAPPTGDPSSGPGQP